MKEDKFLVHAINAVIKHKERTPIEENMIKKNSW